MKKTIICLSLASIFPLSTTVAMEERVQALETENAALKAFVLTPQLSEYQIQLIHRKERGEIGPWAWSLLSADDKLAAELLKSINTYPGQKVDILCMEENNFTLRVDGKPQDFIHKF